MSVAVYLRNFIRQHVPLLGELLTPEYLQVLLEIIYRALVAEEIAIPHKRHLFLIFEHLIQLYQAQEGQNERIFNFFSQLFTSVQAILGGKTPVQAVKGALMVCQAALQSIRDTRYLKQVFAGVSVLLCQIADDRTSALKASLIGDNLAESLVHLDLLLEWLHIHTNILERWESKKYFGYALIMASETYANTMAKLLSVSVASEGLFSCSGNTKLDS